MAESLGGARALYPHWRYGAAVVWRMHVVLDRIRAPALSRLKGGVSAGGVLLEFRGEEVVVISPVNTQASLVCRAAWQTRDYPSRSPGVFLSKDTPCWIS